MTEKEKSERHWTDFFPEIKINILALTGLVFGFLYSMAEYLPVQAIIGIGSGYMGALAVVVKDLVSSRKSSGPPITINQNFYGVKDVDPDG